MTTSTSPQIETVRLGKHEVPRIFNGLWQLSSNAWGSAPAAKIREEMNRHVESGFFAFDMADHYGSAEPQYGSFKSTLPDPLKLFGATKWCVFKPINPTREVVEKAVRIRNERMQTKRVDLLQIHWQDYSQKQYLTAFKHLKDLQNEGFVSEIGLCNFDSVRTEEICQSLGEGVVVSNQVQFSLIDIRPLYAMGVVCQKYGVKLLTYGTLCGGFLSDKYLNASEPDFYDSSMTPSQRKYLDIILSAWGTWPLFQTLLKTLRTIADRHSTTGSGSELNTISISNVATRWVLDFPFVGSVLIGTRLGVSSNLSDNARVFSLKLTDEDRKDIQSVIDQSNGARLIETIGDCGAEYR